MGSRPPRLPCFGSLVEGIFLLQRLPITDRAQVIDKDTKDVVLRDLRIATHAVSHPIEAARAASRRAKAVPEAVREATCRARALRAAVKVSKRLCFSDGNSMNKTSSGYR